jgi:inactivated superfamily I helicase
MPPLVIPTLLKLALGAAGAAALVHWAVKEARRIGEELERVRVRADPSAREALPTLRRDPVSGEWRLM